MKILLRTCLSVLAVTLIASHVAQAEVILAPEMDPAMGIGALAFVGGAIMVIRGRMKA